MHLIKAFNRILVRWCFVLTVAGFLPTCEPLLALPKSKRCIAQLQLDQMEGGLGLFRYDVGRYPKRGEGLKVLVANPGIPSWQGPYLDRENLPMDPWGGKFVYESDGNAYRIKCYGADGLPGGSGEDADLNTDSAPSEECNCKRRLFLATIAPLSILVAGCIAICGKRWSRKSDLP